MIEKDHKQDGILPICDSIEMNYFTKNKLVFSSKLRLLAYMEKVVASGQGEFYFRVEGKLMEPRVFQQICDLVKRYVLDNNKLKIQYTQNENIGIFKIKFISKT